MKLDELIEHCKTLPKPDFSHVKEKDKAHYICESTYITLHTECQLKTLFIILDMCPPVKLVFKQLLKMYMEKCDPNFKEKKQA